MHIRLLFACIAALALCAPARGQESVQDSVVSSPAGPIFIVPIEGLIDKGLARYIDRAVSDAHDADAAAIIFHMDTFGGLVDAADMIRKTILDSDIRTVSFIDKNAASAGALISYAADKIVMVPGASIGAATVVEGGTGEEAPDKYQSYMRGLMRATAEANGRDPRIAEAMVDETIVVEGVSEAGKVLTLSANEAATLGVSDATLGSIDEVVDWLNLVAADRVYHESTRTERAFRFFASPLMQSILMLMMMGGLYFELQTPGVGFAGMMALLGAALFFAPNYFLGLAESWEILVFLVGLGLLALEVFVIPGFGVAGITGIVFVIGSLVVALIGNIGLSFPPAEAIGTAVGTMAVTLVVFAAMLVIAGRMLPKSTRFNQLVLAPELSSSAGYVSAGTQNELAGRVGTALTNLRPAGAALIDGERVDVVTVGEFISAGEGIEVRRVRGSRVEVRRKSGTADNETSDGATVNQV